MEDLENQAQQLSDYLIEEVNVKVLNKALEKTQERIEELTDE